LNRNTFTKQETNAEAYIFKIQKNMFIDIYWVTLGRLHSIFMGCSYYVCVSSC